MIAAFLGKCTSLKTHCAVHRDRGIES